MPLPGLEAICRSCNPNNANNVRDVNTDGNPNNNNNAANPLNGVAADREDRKHRVSRRAESNALTQGAELSCAGVVLSPNCSGDVSAFRGVGTVYAGILLEFYDRYLETNYQF